MLSEAANVTKIRAVAQTDLLKRVKHSISYKSALSLVYVISKGSVTTTLDHHKSQSI